MPSPLFPIPTRTGLFVGDDNSVEAQNRPFWVKITGTSGAYYTFVAQYPLFQNVFSKVQGGRLGLCFAPNNETVGIGTYVRVQRAFIDQTLGSIIYVMCQSTATINTRLYKPGGYGGPISCTIAAGSDGQVLPQGTINVNSTTGFPTAGQIAIDTAGGTGPSSTDLVNYTGTTSTTFTGCTGGVGTLHTSQALQLMSVAYTWQIPSGLRFIEVEGVTGGGAAGRATSPNPGKGVSGGGGGGGWAYKRMVLSAIQPAGTTLDPTMNGQSFPQATVTVISATGYPPAGQITVANSAGVNQVVSYTGTTSTTFTGCTGGTGTFGLSTPVLLTAVVFFVGVGGICLLSANAGGGTQFGSLSWLSICGGFNGSNTAGAAISSGGVGGGSVAADFVSTPSGDLIVQGEQGGYALIVSSPGSDTTGGLTTIGEPGRGGSSRYGSGRNSTVGTSTSLYGFGDGSAGAYSVNGSNQVGHAGQDGLGIIREYIGDISTTQAALSATSLGTASANGTGAPFTATIAGVTVPAGSLLIVQVAEITLTGPAPAVGAVTFPGAGGTNVPLVGTQPKFTSGSYQGGVCEHALLITTATTGDIVVSFGIQLGTQLALMSAEYVPGLLNNSFDQVAGTNGTSGAPDTGATPGLSITPEYCEAAFLLMAPSGSETWGGGFTNGSQDVTGSLGGTSFTLTEGRLGTLSLASVDASLGGLTQTAWAGVVCTFD